MTEEVEKKEKKSVTGKVVSNSMEKTITLKISNVESISLVD